MIVSKSVVRRLSVQLEDTDQVAQFLADTFETEVLRKALEIKLADEGAQASAAEA